MQAPVDKQVAVSVAVEIKKPAPQLFAMKGFVRRTSTRIRCATLVEFVGEAMYFRATVACLLLVRIGVAAEEIKITTPAKDSIIFGDAVEVSGTVKGGNSDVVELKVSNPNNIALIAGPEKVRVDREGRWTTKVGVRGLVAGQFVLVEAGYGNATDQIFLTKGDSALVRKKQKVVFTWTPQAKQVLEEIAKKTLQDKLTKEDLSHFLQGIEDHTTLAFSRAFSGLEISIADKVEAGSHEIRMLKNSGTAFGRTFYDYGNQKPEQVSEVWVGSVRDALTDDFGSWGPMVAGDSWQVRMVDLGEMLGRTAAHEFGHGLGLVGPPTHPQAKWMQGNDDGHNAGDHPRAERFKNGWFIMDECCRAFNNARLAEPNPTERTTPRRPAVFNAFNRSYLGYLLGR